MKILHILTDLHTGGAQKFCVDLCNTQVIMTDNDIFLCVLDCLSDEQPMAERVLPGVNLISLNKKGGYSLKIIYKIYKLISDIKPDIIHLNGRALIYASVAILIKRIPSVYTVHTMADKEYNKYFISYIKILFNYFSMFFLPVSISKSVNETVKRVYGAHFDNVIVNGSSKLTLTDNQNVVLEYIDKLKSDNETLVFVYVGRVDREKNILLLVESFNQLLLKGHNVLLCIIGPDSSSKKDYLAECVNINRYPERIKFLGRKENIADYILCADAVCLTSNYEGLGIAALEAFSMGVPVLSTPSGGPSDIIISGINGEISEEISVESYTKILKRFTKNPLRNKNKIKKLYKEKYTMKVCALAYLTLYKKRMKKS